MTKILTITVPSYNAENYLKEDLPSFMADSILKDLEILIVDDGSRDGTKETGLEFQKKYPDTVRVISKENGGHGSAVNTGIREARGKYFKVVVADDWVDPSSLVRLVEYLRSSDSDLVLSPFYYVDDRSREKTPGMILEEGAAAKIRDGENYFMEDMLIYLKDTIQMHGITILTSILKENSICLDENHFYVDQEYVLYPIPYIRTVSFCTEYVYYYRTATDGQSMNWNNMIKNRSMHGEVLQSMIKFYNCLESALSEKQKEFFLYRCAKMLNTQATIYLVMDDWKAAKKEIKQFEKEIRNLCPQVYFYPYSAKVTLLRNLHYLGYRWISIYTRKVNGR